MLETVRRVGQYEIVDTIARGGMAVVYRARQPALNRTAALKQLDLHTDDPTMLARFLRESRLAAALEHPNIVTVFDYFEDEGTRYIAMEYLPRGSLRPLVGNLTEVQVFGVLEGILAGLAHAQEHKLAHRDLKPENVLLTRRGAVKIADFGIARPYQQETTRLTATGVAVGTPTYMAPEQATGSDVGPETDLYALGIMAFELFAGCTPFPKAETPMAILLQHLNDAPLVLGDVMPDIDPRVSAWVARLLAKDPGMRPDDALEAWSDLEEIVVDLHGSYWRRSAPIAPAGLASDEASEFVTFPGVEPSGAGEGEAVEIGGRTVAPQRGADAPVGEPPRPVGAPVRMLIRGPDATVAVRDDGDGAVLRHVTRWRRPRARRRRDRLHPRPARFDNHVDRATEIAEVGAAVTSGRAVNLFGERAIGKTHVLVEALHQQSGGRRDDVIFLDGRGQSADDLLHAMFEEFYVCRTPVRDAGIARHFKQREATVAIEDVSIAGDELRRLVASAPHCRFVFTSRQRVLWDDAQAVPVKGMKPEHAPALAVQELGRALDEDEQRAAVEIAAALGGHPLRLRQAFSDARHSDTPLSTLKERLARPPVLQDRLASLSPSEARVVRALAVYGGVSVAGEHLRAVVDEADLRGSVERLEQRHDVAVENGRYRLLGVLAHALPLSDDLVTETNLAVAHFTTWLESRVADTDAALDDMPAVLALIERSFFEGRAVEAIRLGRAAEGYLSQRQRWAAWGLVLAIVLASARDLSDGVTEGWALNQLGTRSLGLGRTSEAQRLFEQAHEVRLRAGDERGAAAARQNLEVLQHMPPPLPRLSHSSLGSFGSVVIVIGAIVVAGHWGASANDEGHGEGQQAGLLTLNIAGNGQGVVHGAPGGITCARAQCVVSPDASGVTLTAVPAKGSRFAGWTGACSGKAACRLPSGPPHTVTARFVKAGPKPRLTVHIAGRGTVEADGRRCTSDCRLTVDKPRRVRLTAKPDPGWKFAGWEGACHGDGACRIRIAGRRSVTARFVPVVPADHVTISVIGISGGNVVATGSGQQCTADCVISVPRGQRIELTAKAADGAAFAGWSGVEACATASTCGFVADSAVTLRARFTPAETVRLIVGASGQGHVTVDGRPNGCAGGCEFEAGTQVTLHAVYDHVKTELRRWTGARCDEDRCTLKLTDDVRATAEIGARRLQVTWANAGPGSVDGPKGSVHYGDMVELVATPGHEAVFDGWEHCAPAREPVCRFRATADRKVRARFTQLVGITARADGDGAVEVDGRDCSTRCLFENGSTVTLAPRFDADRTTVSWTGVTCGADPCRVKLTGEKVASARFSPRMYRVTVETDGQGFVDRCATACEVAYGTELTFKATPGEHARLKAWENCSSEAPDRCRLTVTEDVTIRARFEPRMFTLAIDTDGDGTVTCGDGDCAREYPYGTTVELTANPAASHRFQAWDGCEPADKPMCTLRITQDTTVTARFVEPVSLTLAVEGDGKGELSADGRPCRDGCEYLPGDTVTINVSDYDAASTALTWKGADCDGETCVVRVDATRTVTAVFTVRTYTLDITNDGPGWVSCDGMGNGSEGACEGTYRHGDTITLTAHPYDNYFDSWAGCDTVEQERCTVTLTKDTTVTVRFVEPVTLRLHKSGDGSGEISAVNGACTSVCRFRPGTTVTIAAKYEAEASTLAWKGAGDCVADTCAVTLTNDLEVTAEFTAVQHKLAVITDPDGGSVSCDGAPCAPSYPHGKKVTLTAGPSFGAWDGCEPSDEATCTVTITEDTTVKAYFGQVWIEWAAKGDGTLEVTGREYNCDGGCLYPRGSTVRFAAEHNPDATTLSWTGLECDATECSVQALEDMDVTAVFTPREYELTVEPDEHGAVDCDYRTSCSGLYRYGDVVTMRASGKAGYAFHSWDGCEPADNTSCSVEVTRKMTVRARFAEAVDITIGTSGRGSARVDGRNGHCAYGTCPFLRGSEVTFSADYVHATTALAWTGLDCDKDECTVQANADMNVTAVFTPRRYELAVETEGTGTVSCAGSETCAGGYEHGTTVVLTAKPGDGHTFDSWTGCDAAGGLTCTVKITENTSVRARFVPVKVTLTTLVAGDGTVTVDGRSCDDGCSFGVGTTVTVLAKNGETASGVTWDRSGCSGERCDVKLDADTTVTATFSAKEYRLSVAASGDGGTDVCAGPSCVLTVAHGSSVTINGVPRRAGEIGRWVGCDSLSGNRCEVKVTGPRSVSVSFNASAQDTESTGTTTTGGGR